MRYDIIFWAHGFQEIDRYLPLMVTLKERGVTSLLFYQNYKAQDELSLSHKEIIRSFDLHVKDYSSIFSTNSLLILISWVISITKIRFLRNKLRGLRSKILQKTINRRAIKDFIEKFKPKINIFDFICITSTTKYPYGSNHILDVSKEMGIKNFAIPHGIASYIADHLYPRGSKLSYDKVFVADKKHKMSLEDGRIEEHTEVIALGDPRFDSKWKKFLRSSSFRKSWKTSRYNDHCSAKFKVLYLCPNLEQIGFQSQKYDNLKDVAKILKDIDKTFLMIKPHPRYRHEHLIVKAMRETGFNNFKVLNNDPVTSYADYVDLVISSATSAFFDFMPENHEKIIVYDNFMKNKGVENLFYGHIKSFSDRSDLARHMRKYFSNEEVTEHGDKKKHDLNVMNFCREMVAGGGSLEEVVNNYCSYFIQEMEDCGEQKNRFKE